MTSRRQLRAELSSYMGKYFDASREASAARVDADNHAEYLQHFGYEQVSSDYIHRGKPVLVWRKGETLTQAEKAEADERLRETNRTIIEAQQVTRRETLATVIDALSLKGYTRREGLAEALRALSVSYNNEAPLSVHDESTTPSNFIDTDRLWSDLQTTLRVRAERKAAEADAKVEERVSRLLKPNETTGSASGGFVKGFPSENATISLSRESRESLARAINDIHTRLDGTETGKVTLDGGKLAQTVKDGNAKAAKKGGNK